MVALRLRSVHFATTQRSGFEYAFKAKLRLAIWLFRSGLHLRLENALVF